MFFKGTVTICWREIIPVVKLAHSESGRVVRVYAFVCVREWKCDGGVHLKLTMCFLLFFCVVACFHVCLICFQYNMDVHTDILIVFIRTFLSVTECVFLFLYVCIITAKSCSLMIGSKWPRVVHSKQKRLVTSEDRSLSEHRKTFLSLLMYLWW